MSALCYVYCQFIGPLFFLTRLPGHLRSVVHPIYSPIHSSIPISFIDPFIYSFFHSICSFIPSSLRSSIHSSILNLSSLLLHSLHFSRPVNTRWGALDWMILKGGTIKEETKWGLKMEWMIFVLHLMMMRGFFVCFSFFLSFVSLVCFFVFVLFLCYFLRIVLFIYCITPTGIT